MPSTIYFFHRNTRAVLVAGVCFFIFGCLFAGRPLTVGASPLQTPAMQVGVESACTAADVVILVDQSDSMITANDKEGKRFEAAQTIVDVLGNHSVWLCQGEGIRHRVAVIGFGDTPLQDAYEGTTLPNNPYQDDITIYVEDQVVPPDSDFEQWREDRDEIKAPIIAAGNDQLGATDHYSGLLAARERFDYWRDNPEGEGARRQAIVLITDGEPCLFARGCGEVSFYNINPDMQALQTLTDPNGSGFPWRGADNPDSIYMSVIAMSQRGRSLQDGFFSGWRQITQSHGGDVFSANDLNTNLNTIVTDVTGPVIGSGMQPLDCNSDIWINPYTDNLVLLYAFGLVDDVGTSRATILIDTQAQQISVRGGTASVPAVSIKEYIQDGRNEYYVFQRPVPGRYNITYDGIANCQTLLDIRIQKKAVTGAVVQPNDQASYPATDPPSEIAAEKFRIEVFESIGDQATDQLPLQEIDGYPLELVATVTSEDGSYTKTYNQFTRIEDGVYESAEVIQSPVIGSYDWTLTATVRNPNPDGEPILVFEDSGRFSATEVLPFGFAITQPADGTKIPLNTVDGTRQVPQPIPVAINLVDGAGEPANIDTFLTDDTGLFTASLLQGDTVIETVPLVRTPGSTSVFAGELTNSTAGGVVASGDYTVEVQAAWSPEKYNPLLHNPAVNRAAVGISQFAVVPLDLRITGPITTTVHEANWLRSLRGEVKPVDFYVEVLNAVTEEPVDLGDTLQDVNGVYQAAVVPPSGNPVVVPLSVVSNENFQRLVAEGAATEVEESGEYRIKLDTAVIPLQANYAWGTAEGDTGFIREDTTFTTPSVWRMIVGAAAVLLLVLLVLIIYSLTGGPVGYLALVDTHSSKEVISWRLRSSPRVNRISNQTLKGMGVKEIRARRGDSSDDNGRGVHVTAVDTDGGSIINETIYEALREPFLPEAEIVYKKRPE